MSDKSKELLAYPLQALAWVGQNPEQNRVVYFMATGLYVFLGTIGLILTILQIVYANGNIITIAQNCEAVVIFTELIGKTLVGAIKMKSFLEMIRDVKSFWHINRCVEAFRLKLENTFTRILLLEHLYIRMGVFTTILALIAAIVTKQLPSGLWTMENHKALYNFTLILQEVLIPFLAVYNVAYDSLFLSFCILLKTQFKMLNYFMGDLEVSTVFSKEGEKIYLDKLMSYVKYHKFLLRFSQNMRNTYSPVLLIEYSTVLLILCTQMYVVFERTKTYLVGTTDLHKLYTAVIHTIPVIQTLFFRNNKRKCTLVTILVSVFDSNVICCSKNIFQFIRFSLAMTTVLLQLAFYCIPLNYVTDEAVSVSQGIYESDWHSKHIATLKTVLPLIIQRSQKEIIFRAGGLVEINCRTLPSVLRVSYSACAIMRALKNT